MAIIASDPNSAPNLQLMIERINVRLHEMQLSDRKASLLSTGLPDAIREIKRGKVPSDLRIRQIANTLKVSADYLAGFSDAEERIETPSAPPQNAMVTPVLPKDVPVFSSTGMMGFSAAGTDDKVAIVRYGYDLSKEVDFAPRTPRIWNRNDVFAIVVDGTEMSPRFESGDWIYVDPRRRPAVGEYGFILLDFRVSLQGKLAEDPQADELLNATWGIVSRWGGRNREGFWEMTQADGVVLKLDDSAIMAAYRVIPWLELLF